MKDGLVRADELPLVFRAVGADNLPRGARVRVRITGTDLLTLDLFASVAARIDDPATVADDTPVDDAEVDEAAESAGPLTLAIELKDDEPEQGAVATSAA
jgi:exoribonuclease-2